MAAHAQEVRSLPIGTSPPWPARARRPRCAGATEPACAGTDIRKSARDHYLVNKLLALLSKNIPVAARSPSRNGVAHANSFPAAGRLMRAGRAGAGGGSDARAHHRPSLSRGASENQCERDHDTSLSQRRLGQIFDLHFTTHTSTLADRVATSSTHAQVANCPRHPPPPPPAPAPTPRHCATFDNFSRKLTCTVTVAKARLVPRGRARIFTSAHTLALPSNI
ncbi:Uncharacterized protein OBRU01_00924 [Operophtera brumata]|uniref:Uncharacterized protein n=1 Tax=Operophtera brumata TaxID=104452 RepID=A0A0L7LUP3_OPEBR|nr:Uncharacterized protein OBRU01_00924 [Operophtera brumata]